MKTRRWRSSMVEQLICNQQAAGSIPIASSADTKGSIEILPKRSVRIDGRVHRRIGPYSGWVPERSKGTDCKSVATGFEGSNPSPSTTYQEFVDNKIAMRRGSSSVGRALAFQARRRGFEPRLPLSGHSAAHQFLQFV